MKIHKLKSGLTVGHISPHSFKFSDGSEAPAQDRDFVKTFVYERIFKELKDFGNGVKIQECIFNLSDEQLKMLKVLSESVDIIIVPRGLIDITKDRGVRDEYPNVVSQHSTKETLRLPVTERVVDLETLLY